MELKGGSASGGHQALPYLRQLPSVDELLREEAVQELLEALPRWAVVEAVREILNKKRQEALAGCFASAEPSLALLLEELKKEAKSKVRPNLRRVINATGVILHTNFGRALLSEEAASQLLEVARGYSNLEYDLEKGERGSRQAHLEGLLMKLTGAEAALVVNNNAAAVLLAINTLADGKEVIVSRGELIEIGDSFRIPDIMRKAGGILKEVGTTNRTHLRDYEAAISERTALLLKVHTSNFRILGFTASVPLSELVELGRRLSIPVMEDLGSGALLDLSKLGLRKEPVVAERIRAGADLVTFSGDKLLGGPQAGIIVGKKKLIERLRRNPLARAVRIDKFTVAALETTLRLYLDPEEAIKKLPVFKALSLPKALVEARARRVLEKVEGPCRGRLIIALEDGLSEVGGGALPLETIPTKLLSLHSSSLSPEELEAKLRLSNPPVMARIKDGKVLLDLRTVLEEELEALAEAILSLVNSEW